MPANREKTGRRASRTSFQPGQSGNPSGRPKRTPEERAQEVALEAACRAKTKEALNTIVLLMKNAEKDSVKLAAAQFILERGWGKAVQPNVHSGKNGTPIEHRIIVELVRGSAPKYGGVQMLRNPRSKERPSGYVSCHRHGGKALPSPVVIDRLI